MEPRRIPGYLLVTWTPRVFLDTTYVSGCHLCTLIPPAYLCTTYVPGYLDASIRDAGEILIHAPAGLFQIRVPGVNKACNIFNYPP